MIKGKEKIGDLIFGGVVIFLGCCLCYIGACVGLGLFTTQPMGVINAVILPIIGALLLALGIIFIAIGQVPFTFTDK